MSEEKIQALNESELEDVVGGKHKETKEEKEIRERKEEAQQVLGAHPKSKCCGKEGNWIRNDGLIICYSCGKKYFPCDWVKGNEYTGA